MNEKAIKKYWDQIFKKQNMYDPFKQLPYENIENAIEWLCEDAKQIFDFGCGAGKVLNRCIDYGVDHVYGIDLSETAIQLAQKISDYYGLNNRSEYVCGNVDTLTKIQTRRFDGVVLFNILDNITPEEGKRTIKETHRILNEKGRVIIKLNPYFSPKMFTNNKEFIKISDDVFQEKSGIYLWNIHNDQLKEMLSPFFTISKSEEIEMNKQGIMNRLIYLIKKA